MDTTICPCGSKLAFAQCCGPVISSQNASSAEALMRSRYTAYTLRDADYLLASWHPSSRPAVLRLQRDEMQWLSLKIVQATETQVSFVAYFQQLQEIHALREDSRFSREAGRWFYLDGIAETLGPVAKNSPCPCGSGKKFKRCCAIC